MSYIIHKQEIRMLDPKEFHYMYVLTAEIKKKKKKGKLRKVKLIETEEKHFSSFLS